MILGKSFFIAKCPEKPMMEKDDVVEEHPFIQTRRLRKTYSKWIMFTTTTPYKIFIATVMGIIPVLSITETPMFDDYYCQSSWCTAVNLVYTPMDSGCSTSSFSLRLCVDLEER